MKKLFSAVSALVLVMGPTLAMAADPINGNSGTPAANPAAAPTSGGNSAYSPTGTPGATGSVGEALPLPADWKKAKGTVQSTDPAMNQVKIKDETGNLSLVTIDSNVVIKKDGKKVQLGDLQAGDRITLTRRNAPMSSQTKG